MKVYYVGRDTDDGRVLAVSAAKRFEKGFHTLRDYSFIEGTRIYMLYYF
jgi:hypothetical protein